MDEQKEKALAYLKANPTMAARKIAKQFGVSRRWMEAAKRELMGKPNSGELVGAINADEFIAKFDIPKQVRDHLPQLEGKIISDADFRQSLGIDSNRWARARDRDEFAQYQLKVRDRTYWGSVKALARLKEKLDVV